MEDPGENLAAARGLSWRALRPADIEAITSLAATCLATDGGLPLGAEDTYVREHYLPARPGVSIGAFETSGRLIACAAVQPSHTQKEHRAILVGQVDPVYCGRGFGTCLLEWSIAQANKLLSSCPADRPCVLQLTTESLTEEAMRLFRSHGFTLQFAEDVMRHELSTSLPDAPLPSRVTLAAWTAALAGDFFAVYQAAFRERSGYPNWSREEWIAWAAGDDDFLPELSLLACCDGLGVGFIVCAAEWIVQMGVRPEWRRGGLGSALVGEALKRFRAMGSEHVLLDVNVNNPQAAQVYTRLGFERIGRRARYVRTFEKQSSDEYMSSPAESS